MLINENLLHVLIEQGLIKGVSITECEYNEIKNDLNSTYYAYIVNGNYEKIKKEDIEQNNIDLYLKIHIFSKLSLIEQYTKIFHTLAIILICILLLTGIILVLSY